MTRLGLVGLACWNALFPLHDVVFRGMIRNLARAAVANAAETEPGIPPTREIPPLPLP